MLIIIYRHVYVNLLLKGKLNSELYKWFILTSLSMNTHRYCLLQVIHVENKICKHVFTRKIISELHLKEEMSLIDHCINLLFF